jgi:hypothetical protein
MFEPYVLLGRTGRNGQFVPTRPQWINPFTAKDLGKT